MNSLQTHLVVLDAEPSLHSPTANTSSAANTSPSMVPTTSKPNSTTPAPRSKYKAAQATLSPRASRSLVSTRSTTRLSTSVSGALLLLTLICLALLLLLAVALLDLSMARLLVLLSPSVLCRVVRLLSELLLRSRLKSMLRWRCGIMPSIVVHGKCQGNICVTLVVLDA